MAEQGKYIIKDREQSPVSEAFRVLRASLQAMQGEPQMKAILFTSSAPGEGKTFTAANTAASLAYAGKKVILVDCDLRKPVQHTLFGLKNIGITNLIREEIQLAQAIQNTYIANLQLIASGPTPGKPAEFLSHDLMFNTIEQLKEIADYVIVDSPPLVLVSDACILASKVDGVILVVDAMAVRVETAQRAMELLKGARANIIGAVLNDAEYSNDFGGYGSYGS
jgi:capsular exopolysaccharide synthesis family protein